MAGENLTVCMPLLRVNISTQGVYKPVVGLLRQMGIQLVIYLDDILIMHHSKEELSLAIPPPHMPP